METFGVHHVLSQGSPSGKEVDRKRLCVSETDDDISDIRSARASQSSSKRICSSTAAVSISCDDGWGDRFFERQTPGLAQCGKHALNNVFGGPQFLPVDMKDACMRVLAATGEDPEQHTRNNGWYSHSVLAEACDAVADATGVRLEVRPLYLHPTTIHDARCRGAVVNIHNVHWTAIVKHGDEFWYVDSCGSPKRMMMGDFEVLLQQHPSTFAVVSSDYELPEMQ